MKKGFTLAEIMIVLSVIAVLTAILLPAARNAMPNENVLKFKKGHNTLLTTISELVNSDKYYLNGDLGTKINGDILHNNKEEYHSYFMSTFADVLSLKFYSPKVGKLNGPSWFCLLPKTYTSSATSDIINYYTINKMEIPIERFNTVKQGLNTSCNKSPSSEAKQVITQDGIWYWDPYPDFTFGFTEKNDGTGRMLMHITDKNGSYPAYKIFCMDIDGVPDNATTDDCINECPFAYGINVEGKIFTSSRADEWLNKSIQEK